ncbi:MAG TPA: hypothetical protein VHJ82_06125 [Actinomycetota bacterium]|nr:hypothetical protein [Actinomycetota bacterium]
MIQSRTKGTVSRALLSPCPLARTGAAQIGQLVSKGPKTTGLLQFAHV